MRRRQVRREYMASSPGRNHCSVSWTGRHGMAQTCGGEMVRVGIEDGGGMSSSHLEEPVLP